jgi:hypothetical protein
MISQYRALLAKSESVAKASGAISRRQNPAGSACAPSMDSNRWILSKVKPALRALLHAPIQQFSEHTAHEIS